MLKDFKDFIAKGNVIDLAVAVIIAGAFGAIVASLTDDATNRRAVVHIWPGREYPFLPGLRPERQEYCPCVARKALSVPVIQQFLKPAG